MLTCDARVLSDPPGRRNVPIPSTPKPTLVSVDENTPGSAITFRVRATPVLSVCALTHMGASTSRHDRMNGLMKGEER